MADLNGIGCLQIDASRRSRRTGFFFNAELDVRRLTLVHSQQFESAGLLAEGKHSLDRNAGVVLLTISLDLCPIAAVEGVKPGLQRVSGWRIRDCRRLRQHCGRSKKQGEDNFGEHSS